jgi:V/A-type H+-transporting ATPase subunit B
MLPKEELNRVDEEFIEEYYREDGSEETEAEATAD